jgi:hypothetical protein
MNIPDESEAYKGVKDFKVGAEVSKARQELHRPRFRMELLTVRRTLAGAQTKALLGTPMASR